jgi:hypothetical protein
MDQVDHGDHESTAHLVAKPHHKDAASQSGRLARSDLTTLEDVPLPPAVDPGIRAVLGRQVLILFELSDEVLNDVSLEDCLHKFSPDAWSVHERHGRWYGMMEDEPPNVPVPTLAWTVWHPVWWLETLLALSHGNPAPSASQVEWPGPLTTVPRLRELWAQWIEFVEVLTEDDLQSNELTRFPYTDGRPFAYVLGWASMELTKNLSEMCLLRRLIRDQRST